MEALIIEILTRKLMYGSVGVALTLLYLLWPAFAFKCRETALNIYIGLSSIIAILLMIPKGRSEENLKWCCRGIAPARWIFGIHGKVRNVENMIQDRPCVIISNHQATLDLFGMADLLPPKVTYLVKREFLYYGPIGLCFWLSGAVFVDRKGKDGKKVMEQCARQVLKRNLKIWIFPEGTRNRVSGILPFRKGAFNLAVAAQIPIVPVVFKSYSDFYDPAKNLFKRGNYTVEVLPPIPTTGLKDEDVSSLCKGAREVMVAAYDRLSKENRSNSGRCSKNESLR